MYLLVSRGSVKSKKKGDNAGCQVSPDAIPILKEALEVIMLLLLLLLLILLYTTDMRVCC